MINNKIIGIFHHVYQIGDWRNIYTEQVMSLQRSGLFDAADYIFVSVNGNEEMPFILSKVNVYHHNIKNNPATEYYAMKALYDFSCLHDSNILCLHAKGVTWTIPEHQENTIPCGTGRFPVKLVNINVEKWRRYIEYFLIEKWEKCNSLLETYDVVGTEWVTSSIIKDIEYNIPHYSGGMWWGNSSYIKSLDPNFITNNMILGRFANELWVGTKNPNYFNFYNSNSNLYFNSIEQDQYEGAA